MKTNGNSQAFASLAFSNDGTEVGCPGLTKREYFAAMAMQGYFAAGNTRQPAVGRHAVAAADALIAALNDGGGE